MPSRRRRAVAILFATSLAAPLALPAQVVQTGAWAIRGAGISNAGVPIGSIESWRESQGDGSYRHWFQGTAPSLEQAWGGEFADVLMGVPARLTGTTRGRLTALGSPGGVLPWSQLLLWEFTGAQAADGPFAFTSASFVTANPTFAAPELVAIFAAYRHEADIPGGGLYVDQDLMNHNFALVATVPEPGTWALMGTGLLAVGGIAARRRRSP
jgi:hypothetical protein